VNAASKDDSDQKADTSREDLWVKNLVTPSLNELNNDDLTKKALNPFFIDFIGCVREVCFGRIYGSRPNSQQPSTIELKITQIPIVRLNLVHAERPKTS
jgi:hypothetical protein